MPDIRTNLNEEDGVNDFYEVRPLNLDDKFQKKAALRELQILQTRCLSDYKTWAKEYVKYQDFGKGRNVDVKLKQCNDQYTLSILTSCLGPLREGITLESVFTTWMTYSLAKATNKNMDEDMSRLFLHFREGLVQAADNSSGMTRRLLNRAIKASDKSITTTSADLMNNNIATNLRTHELDSLSMSPRQLAVLKLNFMEQFYVDSRSLGDMTKVENRDKYRELKQSYDTAVRHIEAIANNSGYSMDVVAVEERYFVGLKMQTNPDYANVFNETSTFGIVPEMDGDGNVWSGRFKTADGHSYTTGGSKVGTFSPREPYSLKFNAKTYDPGNALSAERLSHNLADISTLMEASLLYIDSDDCDLSKSDKKEIKENIRNSAERYKNQLFNQLRDDRVFDGNEKQIRNYIDSMFADMNNDTAIHDKKVSDPAFQFHNHVDYVVEKEILNSMRDNIIEGARAGTLTMIPPIEALKGSKYDPQSALMYYINETGYNDNPDSIKSRQDISDDFAKMYLYYQAQAKAQANDYNDSRTIDEILKDTVNNYIDDMSNEERTDLMLHVCSNMLSLSKEQRDDGWKAPKYTVSKTKEERKARRGEDLKTKDSKSGETVDYYAGSDYSEDKSSKKKSSSRGEDDIPDIPDDSDGPDEPDGPEGP